ncbi:MAG TPA: hypothetical protein VH597_08575 [Verrucomicrobiae bacterium]|jgi:hypothetical protein|nr:hypothetical protein [Verrucomicrobiae bacterium]
MKTSLFHSFDGNRILGRVILATVLLFLFFTQQTKAFSLLGPFENWMTVTNGFMVSPSDLGGPMDITQGYRWNVPVITYAFDQSFIDCFGTNGVAAVEGAIQILNDLPPASQIDLNSYPPNTTANNLAAASASLVDLKSAALFLVLQQLGLAQPTRYAFCLHDFDYSATSNIVTAATILDRNFDPVSFLPTNFVNRFEYTNFTVGDYFEGQFFAMEDVFALDPLTPIYTAVADSGGYFNDGLLPGTFYTRLTFDDVGGLHFLLRTNNFQFEPLLSDVHGTGTNAGSYVNVALRAGIDKITFIRQDYDPLLERAYVPVTNQFADTYLTNNTIMHQQLERIVSTPDIIFTVSNVWNNWGYQSTCTSNWLNNANLAGNPGAPGPGIIRPPINIAFEPNVAATIFTGDFQPENTSSISQVRWGSFDNSTNSPVVYPVEKFQQSVSSAEIDLQINGNDSILAFFSWDSPMLFGKAMAFQTSTNLLDWTTAGIVTNWGLPITWAHNSILPQRFFRVVPSN